MTFGVTPQGFNGKTESDVVESLKAKWLRSTPLGFGQDQDLTEDSPNAILIGLVAAEIADSWRGLINLYNQQNPNLSDGVNQDNNAALVGVSRQGASSSTANVSLKGDNATIIPIGTQLSQSIGGEVFENNVQGLITNASANSIDLQINTLQPSSVYSIIINSVVYPYTSDANPTYDEIVLALKASIENADIGLVVTNNSNGAFNIESEDLNDTNNINATSLITIDKVQSILQFSSINTGEISVPATSIDKIDSSIFGLDSVINFFDGQVGSQKEDDTELRIRRNESVAIVGASNAESVKARLLNDVEGVSYVNVLDNDTLVEVQGINPKSMEAIIEGGADNDIAKTLLILKTGGISFDGNTTVNVLDSEGVLQVIKFSRPEIKFAWVRITIDEFNPEESLPTNFEQAIIDEVVSYADQEFSISDDIILQKLYTPVYKVSGIKRVTIEIAITDTVAGTPIYQTTDISILIRELANFDATRVSIIVP